MKKGIVCLTLFFYTATYVLCPWVEAGFWQERRENVNAVIREQKAVQQQMAHLPSPVPGIAQSIPMPQALLAQSAFSQPPGSSQDFFQQHQDVLKLIPPQYGTIRKITTGHQSAVIGHRFSNQKSPIVIHIQDIHQNLEAQKNIAQIIQHVINKCPAASKADLVVGLEGAFQAFDLNRFRNIPQKNAIRMAADSLLTETKISGPIHAALTSRQEIPRFIGIDHADHYHKNVAAYKQSVPLADSYQEICLEWNSSISSDKEKSLNPALKKFDQTVQAYQQKKLSLKQYIRCLSEHITDSSPQIQCFLSALDKEAQLDFALVQKQKNKLIRELAGKAHEQNLQHLMGMSLAYRSGQISYAAFYRALQGLCAQSRVDLSAYPEMEKFIDYVLLSDKIKAAALSRETAQAEKQAYQQLIITKEESGLIQESKQVYLIQKLLDFALTPEEWKEYQTTVQSSKSKIKNPKSKIKNLSMDLSGFEAFFDYAEKRNSSMVDNLTDKLLFNQKSVAARRHFLLAQSQIKNQKFPNPSVAILVAGGFHSQGIEDLLAEKGYACVTVAPKITKAPAGKASAYLDAFTRDKTPLEEIFEGEELFVPKHPFPQPVQFSHLTRTAAAAALSEGEDCARTLIQEHAKGKVRNALSRVSVSVKQKMAKIKMVFQKNVYEVICQKTKNNKCEFTEKRISSNRPSFVKATVAFLRTAGFNVSTAIVMSLVLLTATMGESHAQSPGIPVRDDFPPVTQVAGIDLAPLMPFMFPGANIKTVSNMSNHEPLSWGQWACVLVPSVGLAAIQLATLQKDPYGRGRDLSLLWGTELALNVFGSMSISGARQPDRKLNKFVRDDMTWKAFGTLLRFEAKNMMLRYPQFKKEGKLLKYLPFLKNRRSTVPIGRLLDIVGASINKNIDIHKGPFDTLEVPVGFANFSLNLFNRSEKQWLIEPSVSLISLFGTLNYLLQGYRLDPKLSFTYLTPVFIAGHGKGDKEEDKHQLKLFFGAFSFEQGIQAGLTFGRNVGLNNILFFDKFGHLRELTLSHEFAHILDGNFFNPITAPIEKYLTDKHHGFSALDIQHDLNFILMGVIGAAMLALGGDTDLSDELAGPFEVPKEHRKKLPEKLPGFLSVVFLNVLPGLAGIVFLGMFHWVSMGIVFLSSVAVLSYLIRLGAWLMFVGFGGKGGLAWGRFGLSDGMRYKVLPGLKKRIQWTGLFSFLGRALEIVRQDLLKSVEVHELAHVKGAGEWGATCAWFKHKTFFGFLSLLNLPMRLAGDFIDQTVRSVFQISPEKAATHLAKDMAATAQGRVIYGSRKNLQKRIERLFPGVYSQLPSSENNGPDTDIRFQQAFEQALEKHFSVTLSPEQRYWLMRRTLQQYTKSLSLFAAFKALFKSPQGFIVWVDSSYKDLSGFVRKIKAQTPKDQVFVWMVRDEEKKHELQDILKKQGTRGTISISPHAVVYLPGIGDMGFDPSQAEVLVTQDTPLKKISSWHFILPHGMVVLRERLKKNSVFQKAVFFFVEFLNQMTIKMRTSFELNESIRISRKLAQFA